jgi:hypothetical protein
MKLGVRFASLAGLASVAALSAANPFVSVSTGSFVNGVTQYTTAESILSGTFAPLPAPTTMNFLGIYLPNPANGITTGSTATFTSGSDQLVLSVLGGPFTFSGPTSSISGSWSFLSGTGAYAGIAGGTGTWSASYIVFPGSSNNFATTSFVGDLVPVPEPASMAALVMGLGMLAARRRRKN